MEGGHVLLHVRIFHLPAFPGRTIAQLPNARRSIGDMTAMSRYVGVLLTLVALTSPIAPAYAISLTDFAGVTRRGEPVDFRGSVAKPNNVSGIAVVGDRLVIVSDEIKNPTLVQVLRKEGDAYRVVLDVELPAGDDEVDLEAATADGNVVYVIGSHAATRKIDNGSIDGAQRRKSREQFFRFKLNADGSHGRTEGPKSVMPAITAHAVLAGRKQGEQGRYRGPCGQGRPAVLRLPRSGSTRRLGADPRHGLGRRRRGRGPLRAARRPRHRRYRRGRRRIPDPRRAGGDADLSYRVYFWNGRDELTARSDDARPQRLAEFSELEGGKPRDSRCSLREAERMSCCSFATACQGRPDPLEALATLITPPKRTPAPARRHRGLLRAPVERRQRWRASPGILLPTLPIRGRIPAAHSQPNALRVASGRYEARFISNCVCNDRTTRSAPPAACRVTIKPRAQLRHRTVCMSSTSRGAICNLSNGFDNCLDQRIQTFLISTLL